MAEKANEKAIVIDEDAINEMKEKMTRGLYVHNFKKAIEWEGRTYASLTFDFDKLTGSDCIAVERELSARNIHPIVRSLDVNYQIGLAVRACDAPIGADMIEQLPIRDFNKITSRVQTFLLSAE